MPPPLPEDKKQTILNAIRDGAGTRSAGSIAKEHHVGRTTVLRIAQQAGLGDAWDRTKTLHASRARAIDGKALRTQLALDHLEDAVRIRERLWEPTEMVAPSGQIVMLSLPPARDVKDFMGSVGAALKVSMDVEKHDHADTGVEEAKGLILGMAESLRAFNAVMDDDS